MRPVMTSVDPLDSPQVICWFIPQVPHLRVRERGHPIKGWVATAQRMIASLRRVSGQNVVLSEAVLSEAFTFLDAWH
jgi:hypothetical protein